MLQEKNSAVVNISDALDEMPFPTISFDNNAIGKMAAEHLLAHNLDRFAFIGPKEYRYSIVRCQSFSETIEHHGASCTKCRIRPVSPASRQFLDDSWMEHSHYLEALQQLQPPVGILAADDQVGYGILRAARHLGLRSPEDICLIGVDNDEILCNMTHPNLSSIALPAEELGYQAAAMLDAQMRGCPVETSVALPPGKVALRNSSDFIKLDDLYVADALRYIRNHANRFINVSDVMSIMPISRRSLERRFQDMIGHGIYKEISRCHIEHAKELLERTDWPISRIARESGFNSVSRFEDTFRKETELPPDVYRKQSIRFVADRKGGNPK
jgi:LacI family transcriptional regulator